MSDLYTLPQVVTGRAQICLTADGDGKGLPTVILLTSPMPCYCNRMTALYVNRDGSSRCWMCDWELQEVS